MGIEDRNWYRDTQREKEKERQLAATRAKFARFSQKNLKSSSPTSPRQTGLIPLIVFWCIVMGLLYAGMTHYLKPKQATVRANGELVIQRAQDGHFYTMGRIQGLDVKFLVDTGASLVTVSEAFARKALLTGGEPTIFRTANGDRPGRVVDGVSIGIGSVEARNIKVGVGLHGGAEDEALLGQSFLSKFDITLGKDHMILKPR